MLHQLSRLTSGIIDFESARIAVIPALRLCITILFIVGIFLVVFFESLFKVTN